MTTALQFPPGASMNDAIWSNFAALNSQQSEPFTIVLEASGDGVNKFDTANIQAAINKLQNAGGTVFLKAGTYYLNATLRISAANVRIVGEGMATRLYSVSDYGDVLQVYGTAVTLDATGRGYASLGPLSTSNWKNMMGIVFKDLRFASAVQRVKGFDGNSYANCTNVKYIDAAKTDTYVYDGTGFNGMGPGWYDTTHTYQITWSNAGTPPSIKTYEWTGFKHSQSLSNWKLFNPSGPFADGSFPDPSNPFGNYNDGTTVADGGGGTVTISIGGNTSTISRNFTVTAPAAYTRGGAGIYACGCVGITVDNCTMCYNDSFQGNSPDFADGKQFMNGVYLETCDLFCIHDYNASVTAYGIYVGKTNVGVICGNVNLVNGQTVSPNTGTGIFLDTLGGITSAILVYISESFGFDFGLQSYKRGGELLANTIFGGYYDSAATAGILLDGDVQTEIADIWQVGSSGILSGIYMHNCDDCLIVGGKEKGYAFSVIMGLCGITSVTGPMWIDSPLVDNYTIVNFVGGAIQAVPVLAAANTSFVGINGLPTNIEQFPTSSAPDPTLTNEGALYYDTTLHKLRVRGASTWETITSV